MGKAKLIICLFCVIIILSGCFDRVGRPENKSKRSQQNKEVVVNKKEGATFPSIFNWQGDKQKSKSSKRMKWNLFGNKRSNSPMTVESFIMFIVISAGAVIVLISVLQNLNLKSGRGSSKNRG